MGNEASTIAEVEDGTIEDESSLEFNGFRVLGIQENSPASKAGFVSFLDFILEANGIRLDTKDATFMELIASSEDKPLQLQVYNIKSQQVREVILTPSRKWPGKGLLGVTIRFDSYESAEDQILHVLKVAVNSPASNGGIRAQTDYILGTPASAFRDPDDLSEEILINMDQPIQFYIYNTEEDRVRIVTVTPSTSWGGEGALGAEVAHGFLHRFPSSCRSTHGKSVGYLSLSRDATAATDRFLKQPALKEEVSTKETPAVVDAKVEGELVAQEEEKQETPEQSVGQQSPERNATEPASPTRQQQEPPTVPAATPASTGSTSPKAPQSPEPPKSLGSPTTLTPTVGVDSTQPNSKSSDQPQKAGTTPAPMPVASSQYPPAPVLMAPSHGVTITKS